MEHDLDLSSGTFSGFIFSGLSFLERLSRKLLLWLVLIYLTSPLISVFMLYLPFFALLNAFPHSSLIKRSSKWQRHLTENGIT